MEKLLQNGSRKFYGIPLEFYVNILCYIKNQQDTTLAVLFISNCKVTLPVSDTFCVHHQEY